MVVVLVLARQLEQYNLRERKHLGLCPFYIYIYTLNNMEVKVQSAGEFPRSCRGGPGLRYTGNVGTGLATHA